MAPGFLQTEGMARRDRHRKAHSTPVDEPAAGYVESPAGSEPSLAASTSSPDAVAMVRRATEVLGIDHVARWIRSNIPSLGNQTPYALMQTEDGRRQVEPVLLKVEHGVY